VIKKVIGVLYNRPQALKDKNNKENKNNDMVNDNSLKSRTQEFLFSTFKTKA
jgi:hypothetical protein